MELRPMSSTKQVLKVTQFKPSNKGHIYYIRMQREQRIPGHRQRMKKHHRSRRQRKGRYSTGQKSTLASSTSRLSRRCLVLLVWITLQVKMRFPSLSPLICPGIFLLVSFILCLISLSSDLSLYILLYKTGFFWSHGITLLGSKVGGDNGYLIVIILYSLLPHHEHP